MAAYGYAGCGGVGPKGPRGQPGAAGPDGPNAEPVQLATAYVWRDGSYSVSPDTAIQWVGSTDYGGAIQPVTLNSTDIVIDTAGLYRVVFVISASATMEFGLSLNGIIMTDTVTDGNFNLAGVYVGQFASGDVLRLVNHISLTNPVIVSGASFGGASNGGIGAAVMLALLVPS